MGPDDIDLAVVIWLHLLWMAVEGECAVLHIRLNQVTWHIGL